jgi:uncharacterized protein YndB with AHSA1/START domain
MKLVNNAIDTGVGVVRIGWRTSADSGHLYWAFTEGLGDWLGSPSAPAMTLEPGAAFCIEARPEWGGDAHYGRFVELEPNRRVAMKWISRSLGGCESDVAIDLLPIDIGTEVRVEHAGISDQSVRAEVGRFWLAAQRTLDSIIAASKAT